MSRGLHPPDVCRARIRHIAEAVHKASLEYTDVVSREIIARHEGAVTTLHVALALVEDDPVRPARLMLAAMIDAVGLDAARSLDYLAGRARLARGGT